MPLDRPDRSEILLAVETLLDRDVKPRVDGPVGYHLRIAINLLRILRRELEQASALEALEAEGLATLLPDVPSAERSNALLCSRIREGRVAHADPRLVEHLRATTLAKLAIDQPKYASYLDVLQNGWADTAR